VNERDVVERQSEESEMRISRIWVWWLAHTSPRMEIDIRANLLGTLWSVVLATFGVHNTVEYSAVLPMNTIICSLPGE